MSFTDSGTTKKSIDTDSDSDTDTDEKTYPTLEGSGFVFDNSTTKWSVVNAYVYDESGSSVVENAKWPGVEMTDCGNDLWKYELDSKFSGSSIMVIFNNGSEQIPLAMESGFLMTSTDKKIYENGKWTDLPTSSQEKELTNTSELSSTSVAKGTSVTVKGSAEGGTAPYQYSFYVKKETDSSWRLKGTEFGSSDTVTLTPNYVANYEVKVQVKDAAGTVAEKILILNVTAADTALTNTSTLSADSVTKGTTVTINGSATGGSGSYKYSFYVKQKSASTWKLKGTEFGTAKTATITPSTAVPYLVMVQVKDSNGTIVSKTLTLNVTEAELKNTSTLSTSSTTVKSSVTVNGAAEGGAGSYKYTYQVRRASASSWTTKASNTDETSITLTPTQAETYYVKVIVFDANGTKAAKTLTLKVSAASALVNTSTISAASVKKGTTVTINGSATGGTGSYTYAYYVKQSSSSTWKAKGTVYGTATSATITPTQAVTYDVMVNVKDSAGSVSTKYFTVSVT